MLCQLNSRLKIKRDTSLNWSNNNPILLDGEMILVQMSDGTIEIKFGDGITEYKDLPFFAHDVSSGSQIVSGFISGMIMLWSGSADNIPSGWVLCDGENGSPDLRDKFIVGAGSTYNVGDTGGEATHTLTKDEIPSHSHAMMTDLDGSQTWPAYTSYVGGWSQYPLPMRSASADTELSGGNAPHNNLPPYYALCYIMKT